MKSTHTTGSSFPIGEPIGTLKFYSDGAITMSTSDPSFKESEELMEPFLMTSEFIFHSLGRSDWMEEFFLRHYGKDENFDSFQKKEKGPSLTLIPGGKED